MDWLYALAGLIVGLMVGLTGVGGGSLMAPILILFFGVSPSTAVGTDLWFAAITKSVGGFIHHRHGAPDWQVVRRLALGSLPAAALTVWWLAKTDIHQIRGGTVMHILGGVLILTAIATMFKERIRTYATAARTTAITVHPWQPALTVAAGALLGCLVAVTSVGSGALGAAMLLTLYPFRLSARRLVGTDIVHAVPLTLVAGLGHLWMGTVDFGTLGMLLIGSIPGIALGSVLAGRLADNIVRPILAVILAFAGYRLLVA
ncbi:sulfite exporter TauE/SafE family protein [uncultured Sphingomonas sp.]|uniref:sulfite exporter TauE/SafE family protein n=1 Tax=uncultured Sphingomonas sp. TaxID=158754 RepID=UPI0025EC595C|nr:sulfite exporter TauE/SafE family protein [uncultured Sphingomonas sp.]